MGLRGRGRSRRMRVLRALAWLIVIPVTLGVVMVLPFRWIDPPTSAFILRDPLPAQQQAARHWVRLEQMSWTLPMAVVSAEDQKFPHHHGFDFEAISNALSEDRSRLRGASTLTQQLAKNLYLWPGRSLLRKALEAGFTLLMELLWSKRRILEIYLNVVEFGEGVYGVGAACRRMFHTDPGGVNLTQASLLAAVLPNPRQRSAARPSAGVRRRAAAIRRGVRNLGGAAYLPWLAPPP